MAYITYIVCMVRGYRREASLACLSELLNCIHCCRLTCRQSSVGPGSSIVVLPMAMKGHTRDTCG